MSLSFILKTAVVIAAIAYAGVMAAMYVMQRNLIYVRDPVRTSPADAGLPDVTELIIATPDGENIVTWYGKAKPGQPTLLYFPGNGGALEVRRERIAKYLKRGRGVLIMSYRGYSGSTGNPSEAAIISDARLAYQALIDDGIKPDQIIVYGESLGAAVAVQVAAALPVRGVVLDSPFNSLVERARWAYPWLPIRLLLKDQFLSDVYIKRVYAPVFVLHGELDEVTPAAMGRALFDAANEPKEMKILADAGHNDHYLFGSFEAINAWIDRLWSGEIVAKQAR